MRFLTRSQVRPWFEGKTVAIVGSGPGVLDNRHDFIDSHDIVVRVNNYKLVYSSTGRRTDVFYSFFGTSIKKTSSELRRDGVWLCMNKCPNSQPIESDWHRSRGYMIGVDFRPHYMRRRDWWFCNTHAPTDEEFREGFHILGKHIPTTGFAAILDVLALDPKSVYLTGFDFYRSGIHTVNERWRPGRADDPIGHVPERELEWIARNQTKYPLSFDGRLTQIVSSVKVAA